MVSQVSQGVIDSMTNWTSHRQQLATSGVRTLLSLSKTSLTREEWMHMQDGWHKEHYTSPDWTSCMHCWIIKDFCRYCRTQILIPFTEGKPYLLNIEHSQPCNFDALRSNKSSRHWITVVWHLHSDFSFHNVFFPQYFSVSKYNSKCLGDSASKICFLEFMQGNWFTEIWIWDAA